VRDVAVSATEYTWRHSDGKELTRLQPGKSQGPPISDDTNGGHTGSISIFFFKPMG